jgi:uncharacterized protein with FMN-binding domain
MRKILGMFLTLCLLIGGVGCSALAETPVDAKSTSYTPGTYNGTGQGMYSTIEVAVTVDENTITNVEVISCTDTPVIANAAVTELPEKLISAQSLAVDVTTGATFTSYGILAAAKQALKEAGGDMAALTAPLPKVPAQQLPDENYDVVIIGAGGAGLTAATQIGRTSDYSVLVLEKEAWYGGSTAISGGANVVSNTIYNEQAGLDYSPEEFLEYYKSIAAERTDRGGGMWINENLVYEIGKRTDTIINYFIEEEMPVRGLLMTGVLDEANGRGFLSASVNAGQAWGDWLPKLAQKNGAELRNNAKVTELIIENGIVTGVLVETPTSSYRVNAKKVIVATGGFGANAELLTKMNGHVKGVEHIWNSTSPGATGDALTFCAPLDPAYTGYGFIAAVGSIYNYGICGSPVGYYVNHEAFLYLDKNGERFMDENGYYWERGMGICGADGGYCWSILDSDQKNYFVKSSPIIRENAAFLAELDILINRGAAYKADTLEELAALIGIDEDKFLAECAAFDAESGTRDFVLWGNPAVIEETLSEPPYYAIKTYGNVLATLYGFLLDDNMHIVNSAKEPIPNLFAAGEVAMGNFFFEAYMFSGNAVACALMSGSMAGDAVVAELNEGR